MLRRVVLRQRMKERAKGGSVSPATGFASGNWTAAFGSSPTNAGATQRRCSMRFLPPTRTASFVRIDSSERGRASSPRRVGSSVHSTNRAGRPTNCSSALVRTGCSNRPSPPTTRRGSWPSPDAGFTRQRDTEPRCWPRSSRSRRTNPWQRLPGLIGSRRSMGSPPSSPRSRSCGPSHGCGQETAPQRPPSSNRRASAAGPWCASPARMSRCRFPPAAASPG